MNSACKAWIVATSIAAVETLKDQGVCRWNFVIRSMQQHAKNNIRSYYQAKKLSAQSSSAISNSIKRSKEDSIRKVMDLSCWGPNTIRFQYVNSRYVIPIFREMIPTFTGYYCLSYESKLMVKFVLYELTSPSSFYVIFTYFLL